MSSDVCKRGVDLHIFPPDLFIFFFPPPCFINLLLQYHSVAVSEIIR